MPWKFLMTFTHEDAILNGSKQNSSQCFYFFFFLLKMFIRDIFAQYFSHGAQSCKMLNASWKVLYTLNGSVEVYNIS